VTEKNSWKDRLFGGFSKTSSRLTENLAGLVTKAKLDEATLDDIEDALILSDLGPATAASIREKLAVERFEKGLSEQAVKEIIQREIAAILEPVAVPLEIDAFPRPQVILVIGVNGSGKTTTIAKLAHLFLEQDYGVMLAAGDTFRAAAIGQLKIWAERLGVPIISGPQGGAYHRSADHAACASVAAVRRQHDPETDEKAPQPGAGRGTGRETEKQKAGDCGRRGYHRGVPDRRGCDVRQ